MTSTSRWTVDLLTSTLNSEEERRSALKLQGKEAIEFADALDHALDDPTFDEKLRATCNRTLRKLCGATAILPSSYIISSGLLPSDDAACASGGYADVWKGSYNGRAVAIKALRCGSKDFQVVKRLFCKEAFVWKRLSHANVLPFFGASTNLKKFQFCLVSPWMPYGNINQHINGHPEANRFYFLLDITNGLEYLHSRDLVHGDLKGANILINNEGRAVLADFGLMTIISDPLSAQVFESTTTDSIGGTVRWMAPELLYPERFGNPPRNRTKSSDVYALGMVILEILTGSVPFHEFNLNVQVSLKVVQGHRPARPTEATSMGLSDQVWKMMEGCWKQEKDQRVPISTVLKELNDATWHWAPPPRPVDQEVPGESDSSHSEDLVQTLHNPRDSASEASSVSVQLPSDEPAVDSPEVEEIQQTHSPASNQEHPSSDEDSTRVKPARVSVVLSRPSSVSTKNGSRGHHVEPSHHNRTSLLQETDEYNNSCDQMTRSETKPPWPGMDCVVTDHKKHNEAHHQMELENSIKSFVVSDYKDWGMVFKMCQLASASEINADLALKHLKEQFKLPEPSAQLAAVRLWAIMLRNSSDHFKKESSSKKFSDAIEAMLRNLCTPFDVRETLLNMVSAATYTVGNNHKHDRGLQSVKPANKPNQRVSFKADDPMINPPLSAHEDLKSIGAALLLFRSEHRAKDIAHRLENHFSGELILEEQIVIQFIRSLHAWFRFRRNTDHPASFRAFSFWETKTIPPWPSTEIIHALLLFLNDLTFSPSLDIHNVAPSTIIVQLIQAFDDQQKQEQNQMFKWLCRAICHLWVTEPLLIHEKVGVALLRSAQVPGDVSRVLLPKKMYAIANGPKVLHDDIIKPLTTLVDIFVSANDVSAGHISSATHCSIIHAYAATLHQAFIRRSQTHNKYLNNDIEKPTSDLMNLLASNPLSEGDKIFLPSAYALSIALKLCPAIYKAMQWLPWCYPLLDSERMLLVKDSEELSSVLDGKFHIALVLDRYSQLSETRPSISSNLDKRRDTLLTLMVEFIVDPSRQSPILMWKAIYFVMVLLRFPGGSDLKPEEKIRDHLKTRIKKGKPFVDPGWENMKSDLRKRGLHNLLEGIPSSLLLEQSVFDWRDGFPLLSLYPSQQFPASVYPISNKSI